MRRLLLAMSLLCACACACSAPLRTTVELSRADLEARLAPNFPLERRVLIAALILEHPHVVLEETSDRIGMDLDLRVDLVMRQYTGKVGVLGRLEYDPESATVYLAQPELTHIEVPELPPEHQPAVLEAATLALRSQIGRIPVHHLDSPKEQAMKAFIRGIDVHEGKVRVELGF